MRAKQDIAWIASRLACRQQAFTVLPMKRFLQILLGCGMTLHGSAQNAALPASAEKKEVIQFPNTDARDVLLFYSRRAGKKVFVAPDVEGGVTIAASAPRAETLEIIRKALQEQLGLVVRETADRELLVERPKDRKDPPSRESPAAGAERRVRPIAPNRSGLATLRRVNLSDAVAYYGQLVSKPVFLASGVWAVVTVPPSGPGEDLPGSIRKTLLDKYGIDTKETPQGEVLFDWSRDPKHARRSDPPVGGKELPFLPVLVLVVDDSGLPQANMQVRLDDPAGAAPLKAPDELEKQWMERIALPSRTDERGAAVLFYRGRVQTTLTSGDPVYARPIRGTLIVEGQGFERAEYPLSDTFGRTGLQPPTSAPFLKIVLQRKAEK